MRICGRLAVTCALLTAIAGGAFAWFATRPLAPESEKVDVADLQDGQLVLQVYCAGCHQSGRSGVDFPPEIDTATIRGDLAGYARVIERLKKHEMPPRKSPQPTEGERQVLIAWIQQNLATVADEDAAARDGVARRLQRREYVNAVQDLFGVVFAQDDAAFPKDEATWRPFIDEPILSPALDASYRALAARVLESAPIAVAGSPFETLVNLTRRAFRRPLEPSEVEELAELQRCASRTGLDAQDSLKMALREVLASPQFLFHIERKPRTEPSASGASRAEDFELASRLSFLLWRSVPDNALLDLAERGALQRNLSRESLRMLQDARSRRLVEDFADCWLDLAKLADSQNLAPELKKAMTQETVAFLDHVLRSERSVLELLDADYTFVNEALASHYGLTNVRGDALQRVGLQGTQRGGLLTHASVLIVASGAQPESSPVRRGKWVLERFLGERTPPPPPEVTAALEKTRADFKPGNVRELLNQHRANLACADCHARIDEVGITLDNFDGYGAWRDSSYSFAINSTGALPTGEILEGPNGLRRYLRNKEQLFVRALAAKLLGFALGRELDENARAGFSAIHEHTAPAGHRFAALVSEVVHHPAFLQNAAGNGPTH